MSVDERTTEIFLRAMNLRQEQVLEAYNNPGRGITNDTYVFRTTVGDYMLRLPGRGTEMFCDRRAECALYARLKDEHITDEVCYFEPDTGIRVTVYYPESHVINTADEGELRRGMALLRRFHGLKIKGERQNTALDRMEYYIQCVKDVEGESFYPAEYWPVRERVLSVCPAYYGDGSQFQLVHGDCLPHNFLFPHGREPVLIDWEYASISDPMEDLGDFCHDGDLPAEACVHLLELYLERPSTSAERRKLFAMCASAAIMWGTWSVFKTKMEPQDRIFYQDYAQLGVRYARESLERLFQEGTV
ncbi:MAG: choline kinase family protein [Oscillospiraceae bacterium]|nr:choline kinase family protein [Oscillospiraceae bacterium]